MLPFNPKLISRMPNQMQISQGLSISQAALVIHLRKLIMKLPESLPLGSLEDELAPFATKPMCHSDKDENWEKLVIQFSIGCLGWTYQMSGSRI
jgi:hypothetical protein